MKQKLKSLLRNKTYAIVILIIIILAPFSVSKPAQSDIRAVAPCIGIDYENNNYVLSAQIIIPTLDQSYNQNIEVVSCSAPSILECVDKITLVLGKELGLMHCNVIVLGDSVSEYDITEVMDFFIRTPKIDVNTVLINTNSAYELLMASAQMDNGISYSLNNILELNHRIINATDNSLINFYKNMIELTNSNYIARVEVNTNKVNSMQVSQESGSSSGGSGGESSSKEEKALSNIGKTAIYKGGKKVATFSSEDIRGFNWLVDKGDKGSIKVENLTSEPYNGGGCVLSVKQKSTKYKLDTTSLKPKIIAKIEVLLYIEEIITTPNNENAFNISSEHFINDEVKEKAKEEIKKDILKTLEMCKLYNADVLDVNKSFKKYENSYYKKMIDFYGSADEFFRNCEFETEIKIKAIL